MENIQYKQEEQCGFYSNEHCYYYDGNQLCDPKNCPMTNEEMEWFK